MPRRYLEDGDSVYCTGCTLTWNAANKVYELDTIEDDVTSDGKYVCYDCELDAPFVDDDDDEEDEDD